MSTKSKIETVRKVGQQYAYSSLQLHEAIARKAGFTGTDHKYLGFFLQKGNLTAGELAALSGLTTGAVTGLIDRFEKKGLVKRVSDKEDRRKVVVVPNTEKIMALLKPLYGPFQKESDKMLGTFSDKELLVIESYLLRATELAIQTRLALESEETP
jgi:DNA-binding MarR family transcriptional regulator